VARGGVGLGDVGLVVGGVVVEVYVDRSGAAAGGYGERVSGDLGGPLCLVYLGVPLGGGLEHGHLVELLVLEPVEVGDAGGAGEGYDGGAGPVGLGDACGEVDGAGPGLPVAYAGPVAYP